MDLKQKIYALSVAQFVFLVLSWVTGNVVFSLAFLFTMVATVFVISHGSKNFGDWITTKKINLPKPLSWIGGFVTGLLPNVSFVNSKRIRKGIKDKDVDYHEKMHLEFLYKEGGIFVFFTVLMIASLLIQVLSLPTLLLPVVIALFLTSTEIITNNRVLKMFNKKLEPKNVPRWLYYTNYFFIYFVSAYIITWLSGLL